MSRIQDGELILTSFESLNFSKAMVEPDWESIRKRDAFLNGTGENTITINDDGSGTIDIPSFDATIKTASLMDTTEVSHEEYSISASFSLYYKTSYNKVHRFAEQEELHGKVADVNSKTRVSLRSAA